MAKKVLIFDTSLLCCLLRIPGKDSAGSADDKWDYYRVVSLVEKETKEKSIFVLPLASIIETGNHIAQSSGDRYAVALSLADLIAKAATASSPWAAFTEQEDLWKEEQLSNLAKNWPNLAKGGFSIGDATIRDVADYYAKGGYEVEIVTGDSALKAYQPSVPVRTPRRRQ